MAKIFSDLPEAQVVLGAFKVFVRDGEQIAKDVVAVTAKAVDEAIEQGRPGLKLHIKTSLSVTDELRTFGHFRGLDDETTKEAHRYAGQLLWRLLRESLVVAGFGHLDVVLRRHDGTWFEQLEVVGSILPNGDQKFQRLWLERTATV